ncbi:MAG: GPW/gp25 family protein [Candidatus Paceibacterota bacterium]
MSLNNISSIGLMYPLFATEKGHQNVSYTTIDAIKTDIITLLKTRRGERVMQPNFGIALDRYVFEPNVDSLLEDIKTDIEDSVAFWLPFVMLNEVTIESTNEDKDRNKFYVKLIFSVKSLPTKLETVTLTI